MSRALGYAILGLCVATLSCIAAARPHWLSDANPFLESFVGAELLGLLGVILAITLASIASIHLEFNKIEEKAGRRGLQASRRNVTKAAHWLIGLFIVGFALVVVKPLITFSETAEAVVNGASLLIVVWHVLILINLTQIIFAIDPDIQS